MPHLKEYFRIGMLRFCYRHLFRVSLLMLGLLGLSGPLAAQGVSFVEPLGTPLTFPNGSGAIGMARGDFNNDGILDLAVTQQTNVPGIGLRGFLSIMLGNGDGTF